MKQNKSVDALLEYYILNTQEFETAKQIEEEGSELFLAVAKKMDDAGLESEELGNIFCCAQRAGFYAGFEMAAAMFS